jgi:hypothetical protein
MAERQRAARKALPEPLPSPEEVERNKSILQELIKRLTSKHRL